ncbi:helix-turn-helix domain-containing protein [Brevibacterium sp. Mu109]|uniref:helix-turn-helix domain-containing protein n=1 Tax=Brevibacterium sp. Mu109 TaxID=1255669 RepID=UPI0015E0A227
MTTARTYALSDCNASATAEMLQVDRRTVSDRLHRISHLTGLEIPSFASKVIIYLAFISPASRY